jgi:hypothetical protein
MIDVDPLIDPVEAGNWFSVAELQRHGPHISASHIWHVHVDTLDQADNNL